MSGIAALIADNLTTCVSVSFFGKAATAYAQDPTLGFLNQVIQKLYLKELVEPISRLALHRSRFGLT